MRYLVTGGAGFIGSNLVSQLLEDGHEVSILDNLSRPRGGSRINLEMLLDRYEPHFYLVSIEDRDRLLSLVKEISPDIIIHCAAQTSLRRYLDKPYDDFRSNTLGTLNLLEAADLIDAYFVFLSTNKVYGSLGTIPVVETPTRYDFKYISGISENQLVDPHLDPYSLSKAAADSYCRLRNKKTLVLRLSSIYGPYQWSIPGQGWIGIFTLDVLRGKEIMVAGNGKQVRDILHVSDLVRFIKAAIDREATGVFNIGGGEANSLSILELFELLQTLDLPDPKVSYTGWNSWTQKIYVSDILKADKEVGWNPEMEKMEGIERYLRHWLQEVVLPQD